MHIECIAKTDIGTKRAENEDAVKCYPESGGEYHPGNFFLVADGMGGLTSGGIASSFVVECFTGFFTQDREYTGLNREAILQELFRQANKKICKYNIQYSQTKGMGSTGVVLHFDDGHAYIGHVGDSRCYRWREESLVPLTRDHSMVEELYQLGKISAEQRLVHPRRSVLTRAIGVEPEVVPDISVHELCEKDIFLLCSDGLCGKISDAHIGSTIQQISQQNNGDLNSIANALIELANSEDGADNVSVVLVRVSDIYVGKETAESGTSNNESITLSKVGVLQSNEKIRKSRRGLLSFVIVFVVICSVGLGIFWIENRKINRIIPELWEDSARPEEEAAAWTDTGTAPSPAPVEVVSPAPAKAVPGTKVENPDASAGTRERVVYDPQGEFTVQVGIYQDAHSAGRIVRQLKSEGYPAYAIAQTGKAGVRVRIGYFTSRAEARRFGNLFKKEKGSKYWIDRRSSEKF